MARRRRRASRDHRAGQVRGEAGPAAQQDEVGRGEEGRPDASGQPAQLAGGDTRTTRAAAPGRRRPWRRRPSPGPRSARGAGGLGAFGPGGGGRLEPVPGQVRGRPDQGVRSPVRLVRRTYLPCIGGARTCSQAAGPADVAHIRCAVRLRSPRDAPVTVRSNEAGPFSVAWRWLQGWPTSSGGPSRGWEDGRGVRPPSGDG